MYVENTGHVYFHKIHMLLNYKYTYYLFMTLKVACILFSPPKNHLFSCDIIELSYYSIFQSLLLKNSFNYQPMFHSKSYQCHLSTYYYCCNKQIMIIFYISRNVAYRYSHTIISTWIIFLPIPFFHMSNIKLSNLIVIATQGAFIMSKNWYPFSS